jgi:hypothetical protein
VWTLAIRIEYAAVFAFVPMRVANDVRVHSSTP